MAKGFDSTTITSLESSISIYTGPQDCKVDLVREELLNVLNSISPTSEPLSTDLKAFLEKQGKVDKPTGRLIGLILLRCLSIDGIIPNNQEIPGAEAVTAEFIEKYLPDFGKGFGLGQSLQTYEKIIIFRDVHKNILSEFEVWDDVGTTYQSILTNRKTIIAPLSKSLNKAYLVIFGGPAVLAVLNELIGHIETMLDKDERFFESLEQVKVILEDQASQRESNANEFYEKYAWPLLAKINEATKKIEEDSVDSFKCEIRPIKNQPFLAAKKYPLHIEEREFIVRLPFENIGPGTAKSVEVSFFEEDQSLTLNSKLDMGDIRKGTFEISIDAINHNAVSEANFSLMITWRQQNSSKRNERTFECKLQAQKENIDWDRLRYEEPYSTEVAEGDEFVGRKTKLAALLSRTLKARIQSTYITGQKRVGKTSLAKAAIDRIDRHERGAYIHSYYVEWGDIAKPDPKQAIETLGKSIGQFLVDFLEDTKLDEFDFDSSISDLNEISRKLLKEKPEHKFLIVIDEFDEIHPDMYRYGPLAETFFSNLRTLSSKQNIAFMLVGGENMPFVLSAQGDQLNKFVSESLDYFIESEYSDYEELVRKPTEGTLNWTAEAVRELFFATNGHPFYTKRVCDAVFDKAVRERDAEITDREIKEALSTLASELDINSFAHLWKDSIQRSGEEAESVSLKRCRCLLSLGACSRKNIELTNKNIRENTHLGLLEEFELNSYLNDFTRRNILIEESGIYKFRVPIFEKWLVNKGIRVLISDLLGDEIATQQALRDEELRVTESEIETLSSSWPPYRGQEVTSERIRHWLSQVQEIEDQRLLFKVLKNVKFYNEINIREKLRLIQDMLRKYLPLRENSKPNFKRRDVLISYADGEGKSGQYHASKFAEENKYPVSSIISMDSFTSKAERYEQKEATTVNAILFVDDIAGSGKSLSTNVASFIEENKDFIKERSITILVTVLVSTQKGESKISKEITKIAEEHDIKLEFRICEILDDNQYAFPESGLGFWEDETEYHKAKTLCRKLGTYVSKRAPLGFQEAGLLVVFPDRCPNNSLPILHAATNSEQLKWKPIFERPLH